MESNDQRHRQSISSAYSAQSGILQANPQQYPTTTSGERYRQPPHSAQPPTSTAGAGRGTSQTSYNTYGYGGEGTQFVGQQMATQSLQYHNPTEYASDTQHRSSLQYPQYGSSAMYGVQQQQQAQQQQQQQPTQQSPYESVQQYQPRQIAAAETLASQFGMPVAQGLYVGNEAGPTSAPAANISTPSVSGQYSGGYSYTAQSPLNRESLAPAFVPGMSDQMQTSTTNGNYAQQSYGNQSGSDLDRAYTQYQDMLKQTFGWVSEGQLSKAGESLLSMSEWLLSNAESLGLVRDDQTVHAERIKLWENFNHCWLTALQRQKELTEEVISTGQGLPHPRMLMNFDFMETLGRELVRLCDMMEKHGLVDYQMGVWEEEIIAMLTACLDLIEDQPRPSNPATTQQSISPTVRRR